MGLRGLSLLATLGIRGYELDQELSGEQGFVEGRKLNEKGLDDSLGC